MVNIHYWHNTTAISLVKALINKLRTTIDANVVNMQTEYTNHHDNTSSVIY